MRIDALTACVLLASWGGSAATVALAVGWLRLSAYFGVVAVLCAAGAAIAFVAGYLYLGVPLAVFTAGYVVLWWKNRRRGGSPLPAFRGGR